MAFEIFGKYLKDTDLQEFDNWVMARKHGTIVSYTKQESGTYGAPGITPCGYNYVCRAIINLPEEKPNDKK